MEKLAKIADSKFHSLNREVKRNFAHVLTCQLRSSPETFKTMIGDTFKVTKPVINREFVQKSRTEASSCHSVSYSIVDLSKPCLFRLRHFTAQCLRDIQSKHINEQFTTHWSKETFGRLTISAELSRLPNRTVA